MWASSRRLQRTAWAAPEGSGCGGHLCTQKGTFGHLLPKEAWGTETAGDGLDRTAALLGPP